MRLSSIVAAIALSTSSAAAHAAPASDVQVALLVDLRAPEELRVELEALERALPGVDLALVYGGGSSWRASCELMVDADFGEGLHDVAAQVAGLQAEKVPHACRPTVDLLDAAREQLAWRTGATQRLVVLGATLDHMLGAGRTTLEEAVHRLERQGVVLHALEREELRPIFPRAAPLETSFTTDVTRFLSRPADPLGRVPTATRHATRLSGGTYHVLAARSGSLRAQNEAAKHHGPAVEPTPAERAATLRKTWLDGAYGRRTADGRDVLEALAEGRLRPSEVRRSDVPAALAGVDLEPLLDVLWDFVDARRTLEEVAAQLEAEGRGGRAPGELGRTLAKELLEPRRLPPSRR